MAIIKWFLWRRWFFIIWTTGFKPQPFLMNAKKCNLAGCRDSKIIHKDMTRILRSSPWAPR